MDGGTKSLQWLGGQRVKVATEAGMEALMTLILIMVKFTMDQRRLLGLKLSGTSMAEPRVNSCRYPKFKIKMGEGNR